VARRDYLLCGWACDPEDISLIAGRVLLVEGVLYIHTAFAICFAACDRRYRVLHGRLFDAASCAASSAPLLHAAPPAPRARLLQEVRQQGRARGRFTPACASRSSSRRTLHTRASTFFIYDFSRRVLGTVLVYSPGSSAGDRLGRLRSPAVPSTASSSPWCRGAFVSVKRAPHKKRVRRGRGARVTRP